MNRVAEVEYLVVGSGANGMSPAALLLQHGITDLKIITRHPDFGGVWHENRYPGCTTDIAVLLYQLSWAVSHDWTSSHASGAEMLAYLQKVAREHDLYSRTDFETELISAEWVADEGRWRVATNRGDYFARFLLLATGYLEQRNIPRLANMESFKGRIFHSADWPDDYTGKGDRIAVLGTSSSGVQIVPELQKIAEQVYVFQRTPIHIMPLNREHYTDEQIAHRKANAAAIDEEREAALALRDETSAGIILGRNAEKAVEMDGIARMHREAQIKDPDLLAKLTPVETIFCKRPTLNDQFYPSLQNPNVELIPEAATAVGEHSIFSASGREFPVDTIVMATGFHWGGDILDRIRRRDGQIVSRYQAGYRRAYKSTSLAGCPNLFLIGGPNSAVWNGYAAGEALPDYIIAMADYMREHDIPAFEVTEEAELAWKQATDAVLASSPSIVGGCANYLLDETGHDMGMWPGKLSDMVKAMNDFVATDYQIVRTDQPVEQY